MCVCLSRTSARVARCPLTSFSSVSGLGSATGKLEATGGYSFSGSTGVAYVKPSALEPMAMNWLGQRTTTASSPSISVTENFRTSGIMFEAKPEFRVLFGLTGGSFPFDMIAIAGNLAYEPYLGYEANTGTEGEFSFAVESSTNVEAGDTMRFRLTYSDYERSGDVIFVALQNDCWAQDEFFPIFTKEVNFADSGTVDMLWSVPYSEFLSVLLTESDEGLFTWGSCDKLRWTATARLGTQPFHDIQKSNSFELYVNWHETSVMSGDTTKAMGVVRPEKDAIVTVAGDYTFTWDDDHFQYFHHELGKDVGTIEDVETVEVKLVYKDCKPSPPSPLFARPLTPSFHPRRCELRYLQRGLLRPLHQAHRRERHGQRRHREPVRRRVYFGWAHAERRQRRLCCRLGQG